MKRNRKRQVKMEFVPKVFVVWIVIVVSVAIGYWFMDSKCKQLNQEIRKDELKYAQRENERAREALRWDEKKTPEKLEDALLRNGLAMDYPKATQVVRLDSRGRLIPGQVSLARINKMKGAVSAVSNTH
jgi:cell division protein FtsL